MKTTRLSLAALGSLVLAATALAQVSPLLNYQGRVAVGGVNFNGTGQFKFALVNATGATTFWSNDGTSTAGGEPAAAVALPVTQGLYAVLLGDTTLANMAALPSTVFSNSDVRLRVWFNDGTNGSQLLAPDQRIAAVGYAFMAGGVNAAGVTGTLADAQLPANVARLDANQTFTGNVTFQSASGLYVQGPVIAKGPLADVRAFGAAGNGTSDDTAALQAAINSLTNGGTVLLSRGTYRTTAPLVVAAHHLTLHGDSATILAAHDGVALHFNPSLAALDDPGIDGTLTIQKLTPDNQLGSVGLRLRNCYQGKFRGFSIRGFNYGIYMLGQGSGCVHNLVEPRGMYDNEIQLYMTTLAVSSQTGWVNQNTFIGGRWEYFSGGGSNAVHLWINNNSYGSNGNQFLHLALESPFNGTKAVKCDGILNTFIDIRTEGSTAWEFGANANRNVVFLGTYVTSDQITDNGLYNKIMLPNFDSFHFTSNLEIGKIVTGFSLAGLTPETHLTIGSADTTQTIGINLPVMDGVQNTRAWLTLDAAAHRLDLSHGWSSGGDLDYHFNRDRLVIKSDGNVGIGTTSPGYKLHVNGSVAGVGAYNNLSDARYKTNVRTLDGALRLVERMRGVRYVWKRAEFPDLDFTAGPQIGFVAQELKEVLPEAVSVDARGAHSVAYSTVVPVLVEAMKAQQQEIVTLRKQLADREEADREREARLERLERLLPAP